jgi:two-component system response regulator FixJ
MTVEPVVHVIDDEATARKSLAFLLENAGLQVRTYDSARAFLDQPFPDSGCVITDIRMPGVSGMELLRDLSRRTLRLPVIIVTGHGDIPLAVEAMRLGAVDFIEKPFRAEALLAAVRLATAHGGAAPVDGDRADLSARVGSLSSREKQVLNGLVAGQPNKAIALSLGISPRTVEIYRANVMSKMHASSLSELVRMALVASDTKALSK